MKMATVMTCVNRHGDDDDAVATVMCAEFSISASVPLQSTHLCISVNELGAVTDVVRLTGNNTVLHPIMFLSHCHTRTGSTHNSLSTV